MVLATKFLIKRQHGVDRAADGVALGARPGGGAAVGPIQGRILPHTGGKRRGISGGQYKSFDALRDQFASAATVGGDDRQAAGQRFEHDGAEGFVDGGEHKGIGGRVIGANVFLRADEKNALTLVVIDTLLCGDLLETCCLLVFADHYEVGIVRQSADGRFQTLTLEAGADKDVNQRALWNMDFFTNFAARLVTLKTEGIKIDTVIDGDQFVVRHAVETPDILPHHVGNADDLFEARTAEHAALGRQRVGVQAVKGIPLQPGQRFAEVFLARLQPGRMDAVTGTEDIATTQALV